MKENKEKIKVEEKNSEKITEIASKRGFFWPTAEIYPDRFAGFYEYGPNGLALKNNILNIWRNELVKKENMIEIDGCQILPPNVFRASGHLKNFTDPLISCPKCNSKFRADKLIQEKIGKEIPEKLKNEEYDEQIKKNNIKCPKCGSSFNKTERWNMMFKTGIGAELKDAYLRPETCQSIFVNFPRIFKTSRVKLPFGIAQVGKVFRNEISPRQGLVREREINQMEIEIFFNAEKENEFEKFESIKEEIIPLYLKEKLTKISAEDAIKKKMICSKLVAYYLAILKQAYVKMGFPEEKLRFRGLEEEDKPFYSKETWDFEILTSIGWIELGSCNHRGDYDLGGHQKISKQSMEVVDESVKKKVLPNVFELSMGSDRAIFCILDLTYKEEPQNDRTLFSFKPIMAPTSVAIFPLVNKEGMPEIAEKLYQNLCKNFSCFYDDSGSIGKRYRRQDEIGTPFCITIDGQTLKDKSVTIRERDSMKQYRVKIQDVQKELEKYL